jgi:hypothetical protein
MTTGRTLDRWKRIYVSGYDLSGYMRTIGPLSWVYPEIEQKAVTDEVSGVQLDASEITTGTLNAIFDNTADVSIHAALSSAGVLRNVLVAQGIQGVPAAGDPVFMGAFSHSGYLATPGGGDIGLNVVFGKTSPSVGMLYDKPWGDLIHAKNVESDVNTAVGIDNWRGVASAAGGWMMWQLLSVVGEGSIIMKIQEASSNSNGSFADLTGATSGEIEHTAVPTSGIVQLGITAAVKRYLRWQIVLDGITSADFIIGFVRK